MLAVVVLGLLLTIAYPLQNYLAQRGEINELRAREAAAQRDVAQLEKDAARWQDPAYIRQQAKRRLYFVEPGEKTFVVLGAPEGSEPTAQDSAAPADDPDGTWYERMWSTLDGSKQQ